MKKILILLLTASMIAAAFIGCTDKPNSGGFGLTSEDTNGNGLADNIELKIMEYYYKRSNMSRSFKFNPKDFRIEYYGSYDAGLAIKIWHDLLSYNKWTKKVTIGATEFRYKSGNEIVIWRNGELCQMEEMYDLAILSDNDLENIKDRHH